MDAVNVTVLTRGDPLAANLLGQLHVIGDHLANVPDSVFLAIVQYP